MLRVNLPLRSNGGASLCGTTESATAEVYLNQPAASRLILIYLTHTFAPP